MNEVALTFYSVVAGVGHLFIMAGHQALSLMGFGLGLAVTVCFSNVIDLAPAQARGTALTLRLTGNRIGQFAIPFCGAVLAGFSGVGGVFLVVAALLLATGSGVRFVLRGK